MEKGNGERRNSQCPIRVYHLSPKPVQGLGKADSSCKEQVARRVGEQLVLLLVMLHKSKVRGKGVHLLHSEMSALNYGPAQLHCGRRKRHGLRGGHKSHRGRDAVEEFLACGILPLHDNWSLEVERAEAPLTEVVVPLPKAPAMNDT
jgi:hypothetical protein